MIEKMESNPPIPPPEGDVNDEQELDADDAVEIIELEDGDGLEESVDDLDLEHGLNDENGDGDDEGEMIDDMELEDDAKISFQKHNGSVFCVAVNSADQSMAISGNFKIQNLFRYKKGFLPEETKP